MGSEKTSPSRLSLPPSLPPPLSSFCIFEMSTRDCGIKDERRARQSVISSAPALLRLSLPGPLWRPALTSSTDICFFFFFFFFKFAQFFLLHAFFFPPSLCIILEFMTVDQRVKCSKDTIGKHLRGSGVKTGLCLNAGCCNSSFLYRLK